MANITLIGTTHKEKGLCNAHELFKIIEQISPEVIFEEIPPGKFEAVYAGSRRPSLEVTTIKAYLQKYPGVHHYPVDLDIDEENEKEIKRETDGIPLICNHYSSEYHYLSRLMTYREVCDGFTFLNSNQCGEIILRKKSLEQQVLDALKKDNNHKTMDHETLGLAYKQWIDQIDDREKEMLRNIYLYMEQREYNNALFLVGAAHRMPIMQKIHENESKEEFKLNWIF